MNYTELEILQTSEKATVWLVADENGHKLVRKRLVGTHEVYSILQTVSHPYLPHIYEAEQRNGDTFVLEEYIAGESIGAARLSEKQVVTAILELCDVLALLHQNCVLHRDLKPSNILLAPDGHIRLIDFDAARTVKEDAEEDTTLLGTRGYAPPEQYGFAQTDERADLYALGMTMKKLLGNCADKGRYAGIIRKCTSIDPDKRYRSADEVASALRGKKELQIAGGIVALVVIGIIIAVAWNVNSAIPPEVMPSPPPITNTTGPSTVPAPSPSPTPIPETTAVVHNSNMGETPRCETLFMGKPMDYILLDGKSIGSDGAQADMSIDLNGDGDQESFKIQRDTPNGLKLLGFGETYAINFATEDVWQDSGAFDEYGELASGYFAQISTCDLDQNGVPEVLVSLGDGASENVTAVYSYVSGDVEVPYRYRGSMEGSDQIALEQEGLFATIGAQGRFRQYAFIEDMGIVQIQES